MTHIKKLFKPILAFLIAFSLTNILCGFYLHAPFWLTRSENATNGVWMPNTKFWQNSEGSGCHNVDTNGYLNEDIHLAEGFTLVLGSSHTEGKEVKSGERYVDILNQLLCDDEGIKDQLLVYNMAANGHYYPDLVSGFSAALEEFPGSSNIILEITTTNFTEAELTKALRERGYSELEKAESLKESMGAKDKLKAFIKTSFPAVNVIKSQLDNMLISLNNAPSVSNDEENSSFSFDEYYELISSTAELIRKNYNGNIIILYHPSMSINEDSTINWEKDDTYEAFRSAIEDNDIIFLDMEDAFQEAYEKAHVVPYGFNNTSPGEGHLNRHGHKLIAEGLYDIMQEVR